MNKCTERLWNGLVKENPTLVLMLGMCPTLAVTTSAVNGLGMGLTTTVVLALSNVIISLLRKIIPDKVRKWRGIYIAVLSMENQSKVDYRMVFRAMKSEAAYYERQWKERESEYKQLGLLHKKTQPIKR